MSFSDQTVSEFLENVASTTVAPSGGAVAAVSGAAGAALCEMVCIHSRRKEDYAEVEQELMEVRDELGSHRRHLLDLADEDATAVDELQTAFNTVGSENRDEIVQEAGKHAITVPLKTAEECVEIIEHASTISTKGNQNAIADAAAGAFLAHAALQISITNAHFNAELIQDEAFTTGVNNCTTEIDNAAEAAMEKMPFDCSNHSGE